MKPKKYQIHFTRDDYLHLIEQYEEEQIDSHTDEQLLLVSKSYFIQKQFEKCIKVLKKIKHYSKAKILFEKQALQFKAQYLIDNTKINELLQILDQFQINSKKVTEGFLKTSHLKVFKQFRFFVQNPLKKHLNQLAIQKNKFGNDQGTKKGKLEIKQTDKQLQKSSIKLQGFPCFLISNDWRKKHQIYISDAKIKIRINENGKTKQIEKLVDNPGPIQNFSIVNHIFQLFHYQNKSKQHLNTVLFPGQEFQVVTKKHWNYLFKIYSGISVKRTYSRTQTFPNQLTFKQRMILKLIITRQKDMLIFQVQKNSLWPFSVIPYLQQKYGQGQLKYQADQENFILTGKEKTFEPQNLGTFKYVTFQQKNMDSLTSEELKFSKNLSLMYDFQKYQINESLSNGLIGLTNDKFLCFMNSTLQCLSQNYFLSKYFIQNQFVQFLNYSKSNVLGSRGEITCAYEDIIKKLWTIKKKSYRNVEVNPELFKQVFAKRFQNFVQDSQEDAHQFLNFLLNCLHDDLNKKFRAGSVKNIRMIKDSTNFQLVRDAYTQNYENNNSSKITDLFKGYTYSTLECLSCQAKYYNFDMHLTIPLPLPVLNPSIVIYYLSNDHVQNEAVKFKVYLNDVKTVGDIIGLLKAKIHSQKNQAESKSSISQYFILGINKKNFKLQFHFQDDTQIKRLINLQGKISYFVYQVTKIKRKIVNLSPPKIEDSVQNISQDQSKDQVALIQYKFNDERIGYPKVILIDPLESQQNISRMVAQTIPDQALNVSGGVATQSQKLDTIQKIKLQKIKGKAYSYIIKTSMKLNLQLWKQKRYEQELGSISKDSECSLLNCFNIFRQKDKISIDQQWKCGKCRNISAAEKQQNIYSAGQNLIIVLKRFKQGQKVCTKIEYPIQNLDIKQFVDENYKKQNAHLNFKYDLYGVIVHRGTLNRGHYYSYCKNQVTKRWYLFDDQLVRQEDQKNVVDQNAYILFYKLKK